MFTSKVKLINQKRKINIIKQSKILESVDTIVIIGATSTSITLSITGIGLIILPITAETACTLSLGNKVLHKMIINNFNNYKKRCIKKLLNLLIIFRETLYKTMYLIKTNMTHYVIFVVNIWMKLKFNLFLKDEHKNKIKLF